MVEMLSGLAHLNPHSRTRLVTAENVHGEPGKGAMAEVCPTPPQEALDLGQPESAGMHQAARDLGRGWKVRPAIPIPAGRTVPIMDVSCMGVIQHLWMTLKTSFCRDVILRIYWDHEQHPSVECPIGDFFCNSWNTSTNILALPINVNPDGGFNSFFSMPFGSRARITVENRSPNDLPNLFYAITFAEEPIAQHAGRFHAQFRRANPLLGDPDYTIVDGVRGEGHFVGCFMAWQQNTTGWWGEGEVKFYLDGDNEFPSLCGTGTEDYFGGAWCFGDNFSAPYLGYPMGQCEGRPGTRHTLYRFHVLDPIRFHSDLRVTMQALGWRSQGRFLPLQDDIASVAYWYQSEPHAPFPPLGDRDALEII